jgi:hypothetical protein
MELAKQQVDIGLFTNDLDRSCHFGRTRWGPLQRFDHVLPLRRVKRNIGTIPPVRWSRSIIR